MVLLTIGLLLTGCSVIEVGPQRIEPIDEPLELPLEVTLIEINDRYPTNLVDAHLIENLGRLYLAGGSLVGSVSSEDENQPYYGVWMSEDGIRWTLLTEEFYPGVRQLGFNYVFYEYDGYLWAAEIIFRFFHPDAPDHIRLFRSVDGTAWEIVNEDYDPMTSGSWKISSTTNAVHQFAGQKDDGRGVTQLVNTSINGTSWESVEFQDPMGFFVDYISIHAVANDTPYVWDPGLSQIGRFDVDTLTWEALSIDLDTRAKLFLTEVTERRSRSGAAFVGHNGHLYLIGGSGLSIENPVITDWPAAEILNDVWRSPDGVTWERLGEQLPYTEEERRELGYRYNFDTFPGREDPQVVSWRGVLYLTGGVSGQVRWNGEWMFHSGQDAWVSRDGETWYELARVRGSHEAGVQAYQESREGFVVPGGGP